ncbi:MAG: hypothetical protein KDI89_07890 [Gammaproteobacteria bacterium]|nr:hypothetical protein [Gammaproteobacteria bacterium]
MKNTASFRHIGIGLAITTATLSGCTQLAVEHIEPGSEIPKVGAPYFLPFTQYEITATRRVNACNSNATQAPPVAVDVSINAKEARDPRREYVIDIASLRSFFKTTDLTIDYHPNGALKSINATATDQTGAALTSVFKSVGKLVSVAGFGLMSGGGTPPQPPCTTTTETNFRNKDTLEQRVKVLTRNITRSTANIERLTAIAAAKGDHWSDRDRDEMVNAIDTLYRDQEELGDTNEALKATLKALTVEYKTVWPPDGETFISDQTIIPDLTDAQIRKWFNVSDEERAQIVAGSKVWAVIRGANGNTPIARTSPCAPGSCPEDSIKGLKYRFPVPGEILACDTKGCADGEVLSSRSGLINQLGYVYTLPLNNYLFMDQTITASFSESGQPTSLGATSSAAAVTAASTFGGLVDEVVAYRQANKPKTELEKIQEETALLTAKAELAAAQKALNPPPPDNEAQSKAAAAFQADASVLDAELAYIKADAALREAKDELSKLP